jgi:5,10-methylenetetrahydrofolate reductase
MESGFKNKLKKGLFTVTVEISSPKGTDLGRVLADVRELEDYVDAVNICDNPMANMRMGTIPLAHIIQERTGVETIPHLTCRDRNVIGLQSEILGAWALGIRNIFVVTGDGPDKGDHPAARGVFEVNSAGLINIIKKLSSGKDFGGNPLKGSPDFFIGTAVNPGADDLDTEIEKMKQKICCGVDFIQTQPVYDIEVLDRFLARAGAVDVPVLAGILPLKSREMAVNFNKRVDGVNIPLRIIERMKKGPEEGIQIALELAEEVKKRGFGIHLMPLGNVKTAVQIISSLKSCDEKVRGAM